MVRHSESHEPRSIPVIDLEPSFSADAADRERLARELDALCRNLGFFYVKNHRVPAALIGAQLNWARNFFEQPATDRLAIAASRSSAHRGYEPLHAQTPESTAPPDMKEGFCMGWDLNPNHPLVLAGTPGHGPNLWPADLPGFRLQMEAYYRAMLKLGVHMMRTFALALGLPEDHFDGQWETPMSILRLQHYPPQPGNARYNQLALTAQTDWGYLSILLQDERGGLEVHDAHGHWLRVDPQPDTFVVNVGDMLHRVSNARYQSNRHRVRNRHGRANRYSVPFFLEPSFHTRLAIAPSCIDAEHPPRFETVTAGEFVAMATRAA
jgi:isopenicillin N synthase-like dioxygenase